MADNDPNTTPNTVDDQSERNKQDYNKMVDPSARRKSTGTGLGSGRDLSTAGGGSIPGLDSTAGSGNSPGGMSTSNSVSGSGTTGHANAGGNNPVDRGKETDLDLAGGTRGNTIDPTAQSNIGGRSPDQPQTAMGDQDPQGKREAQRVAGGTIAPMTSRDPNKINESTPQDNLSA